ncbi:MAG: hypothetical protein KBC62_04705 [Candidatus Pacebacteria bacterium]|nr:hypothetical protein [Candidatus Paceibacterota bacterium]
MHIGPTFRREEVDKTLLASGYTPGTQEWRDAFVRNYIPIDDDAYAESDTFDLEPASTKSKNGVVSETSH